MAKNFNLKTGAMAGSLAAVMLFSGLTMPRVLTEGEVGVITNMGRITRIEQTAGMKFVTPFTGRITKYNIKAVSKTMIIEAASKDLQIVTANVSYTYHVRPDFAEQLHKNVGKLYENILLEGSGIIAESFKTETVKYKAEEIMEKRNIISEDARVTINEKLNPYGIIIDMMTTPNLDFSKEYNAAIEAKQIAEQNVKRAEQEKARAIIESETKIAEAQGIAEANRLVAGTTNEKVVELERIKAQLEFIQKWDGKLPQYMLGDSIPLLDINGLGR